MSEDILPKDDPFDDPLWKAADRTARALPRPGKNYITCPSVWLARVRPIAHSADQLIVMMLLYQQCLRQRTNKVPLSNIEVGRLGISRYAKYRALASLRKAEAVVVEGKSGRAIEVTLLWFP